MPKFFRIAIIGAGNVAWHLAKEFENAGHYVTDIYSRRLSSARELANRLYDTKVTNSLDLTSSKSEIFILAVQDDSLHEVVDQLKIPSYGVIAHTSGTQPLDVLTEYYENSGVFYPLQTFTKGVSTELEEVPICIEASNSSTEGILMHLGESISREVYSLHSEDRKILHLAAVFACNFSNHMYTIAQDILEHHGIEFSMLHSLIAETVNKALSVGPIDAQTGPAQRGDKEIVKSHLKRLKEFPDYRKIYKVISDHIGDNYY